MYWMLWEILNCNSFLIRIKNSSECEQTSEYLPCHPVHKIGVNPSIQTCRSIRWVIKWSQCTRCLIIKLILAPARISEEGKWTSNSKSSAIVQVRETCATANHIHVWRPQSDEEDDDGDGSCFCEVVVSYLSWGCCATDCGQGHSDP